MKNIRDNCAIAGVYSKTADIPQILLNGLVELNHRGQEGSGMILANGKEFKMLKDSGLAGIVFSIKHSLPDLDNAFVGIGHNRYSTSGSLSEVQPFLENGIGIAHNGNLTNVKFLKEKYTIADSMEAAKSDTRVALAIINKMKGDAQERILAGVKELEGAFSFIFILKNSLIVVRDSLGFRPMSIGKLQRHGYVVASENSAFKSMGAEFLRDVLPGEVIKIDENGVNTLTMMSFKKLAQCIFELIYIARPDSTVFGIPVMQFRLKQGEILARHIPDVDFIVPVPRSGISAAIGIAGSELAKKKGIVYMDGLYTNPYRASIDGARTFIRPSGRDKAATEKYSANEQILKGKKICLIDDSIVRGSLRLVVEKVRKAGATEVHALIASPSLTHACYMGVDFGDAELLAHKMPDLEERKKYLGLDSLYHLRYSELIEVVLGNKIKIDSPEVFSENNFCGACFTGKYPISIKGAISKEDD